MADAVTVGATLRAGWPVLVIPSAIYFVSHFHRTCNIPMFLFVALMQWLTGLVLDAAWTGLETAGTRVYSATAYRAAFGLCLAVAVGAVALAACITETRCRNVWRSG